MRRERVQFTKAGDHGPLTYEQLPGLRPEDRKRVSFCRSSGKIVRLWLAGTIRRRRGLHRFDARQAPSRPGRL